MASLTVVGSVNLDLVIRVERLPVPGETVSDGVFSRHPGGKGGNQALAARRLGADVSLVAAVGDDEAASVALGLLEQAGVDLTRLWTHSSLATGIAVILVARDGENQIAVAPGANRALTPESVELANGENVICQLEIPLETVEATAARCTGFFALNAAPAREVSKAVLKRADLVIVNEIEHATFGNELLECKGLIAVTQGVLGATLYRHGRQVAKAASPAVATIDTVGAGDAFVGALTVAVLNGFSPDQALVRAVAAGALATTVQGAQPSLPTAAAVEGLLARR
ncbi:MAG: ribokinase [Acidimicrobiia bacterium]